jgi:hypothetical protein
VSVTRQKPMRSVRRSARSPIIVPPYAAPTIRLAGYFRDPLGNSSGRVCVSFEEGWGRPVVATALLANPEVRRYLNGVEPAWTMLEFDSFNALHHEPAAGNQAIRLNPNLIETDLVGSAVTQVARMLLRRAGDPGGLKLTATGNLSRAVVAEMVDLIKWPGLDKDELFALHKVINEPDFLPVHFARVLLQGTKLVRTRRGALEPTRLGKTMLAPERYGALHALLFHIAFWHLNLGYFDRNPIDSWPQSDAGIVLWSLSASANDWVEPQRLTRLCTVPVMGVVEQSWDVGSFAMEARILRPLRWFGLLETRWAGKAGLGEPRLYRKTPLLDQFVKFNVQIEGPTARH